MTVQARDVASNMVTVEWTTSMPRLGPNGMVPASTVIGVATCGNRGFVTRYGSKCSGLNLVDGATTGPFSCDHMAMMRTRGPQGESVPEVVYYDPLTSETGYVSLNGAVPAPVAKRHVVPHFYTSDAGSRRNKRRDVPGYEEWCKAYCGQRDGLRRLDVKVEDQARLSYHVYDVAGRTENARFVGFPELYTSLREPRTVDAGEMQRIHSALDELLSGVRGGMEAVRLATSLCQTRMRISGVLVTAKRISKEQFATDKPRDVRMASYLHKLRTSRAAEYEALLSAPSVVFLEFASVAAVRSDPDGGVSDDNVDYYVLRNIGNTHYTKVNYVFAPGDAISDDALAALQEAIARISSTRPERIEIDDNGRFSDALGVKLAPNPRIYYRGTQVFSVTDQSIFDNMFEAVMLYGEGKEPMWRWLRAAAAYSMAPNSSLRNLRIYDDPTDFNHPDLDPDRFFCFLQHDQPQVLDVGGMNDEETEDALTSQIGRVYPINHDLFTQPRAVPIAIPEVELRTSGAVLRGAVVPA